MALTTRARTLLAACAAASLIAACSGSPDAGPSTPTSDGPTQTSQPPVTDDERETATSTPDGGAGDERDDTTASVTVSSPDDEDCGELSASEAIERWIADVPPAFPDTDPQDREAPDAWGTDNAETEGYDACADLSWIGLNLVSPMGSSPTGVMLFHQGEFVRPATRVPVSSGHEVERLADDEIAITFHYTKDTDTSAAVQSGRARSVFRWDDEEEAIVRTGDLPPGTSDGYEDGASTEDAETGDAGPGAGTPPVPGAYAGAGGALPTGAVPVTTFVDGVGVIISPLGNLGCDLGASYVGCGVVSWLHEGTFPGPHGDPRWWIDLTSGGEPALLPKGDPAYFLAGNAQEVSYGTVVYSGDIACASEDTGFTCWNTSTGHGAFFNRGGFWPF